MPDGKAISISQDLVHMQAIQRVMNWMLYLRLIWCRVHLFDDFLKFFLVDVIV
jgi:hypothetical protein